MSIISVILRTSMQHDIIILGPAHPYRGGIAAFNERLARELVAEGHRVRIWTFTLQYPSFLFPGKTQYSSDPVPEGLEIERRINSVNPLNWIRVGRQLRRSEADMVIAAYWLSYMAPCLGTILRIGRVPSAGLVHNLLPHERKPWDVPLAKYFCRSADSFTALSKSVLSDIETMAPGKPANFNPHPLYDNFGQAVSRQEALKHLGLDPERKVLLSFGLIRDYKGLDWLLEAFAGLKERSAVQLVVAGEFYSDSQKYHDLAAKLGIDGEVIWKTGFVPDSEVKYYFCAADLIVQPYKSATQSGITQIAYHFEKPMLVTDVGGLAETVPDGKAGYVVEPSPDAVRAGMERFLAEGPDFSAGLRETKARYSWSKMAEAILEDKK